MLFLELNGFQFTASEPEAAQAVLELAAGSIDENGYLDFLGAHTRRHPCCHYPEILFLIIGSKLLNYFEFMVPGRAPEITA